MIDLDQFKKVNDRFGRAAGDAALKAFADAVRPLLRDTDHCARMGGEEVAVLLPETEVTEGYQIAERLRRCVAETSVDSAQGPFRITASIGIAEMHADDADAEDTLSRADRALYAAKAGGPQPRGDDGRTKRPAPQATR